MRAAQMHAPRLPERLTWAEMCERYPDQWVCLVKAELSPSSREQVRAGHVVGHGMPLGQAIEQARPWEAHHEIGRFHTGPVVDMGHLPRRSLP